MEGMLLNDLVHLENILDGNSQPTGLKLSLLEYMTDNFSEEREIGRGGFGVVYKGEFKGRKVAVKKLNFSNKAEKEFEREIGSLVRVSHKNIVRFLGYCNSTNGTYQNLAKPGEPERLSFVYKQDRILCFEYISNGSLTHHIHDELRGLEWDARYKIIKEICHALQYLHNEKNLVHRDLKPDNILIDNLWVPKIADLGISKLLDDGVSRAMTSNATMSWGYAAPEFKDGIVSFKYDIYSLGVIIIELVTGVTKNPDYKMVLTRWRHRWNKCNETIRYQQVAKCIEIGLSCRNERPKKRPSISKILEDLEDVDCGNGVVKQVIPCWNDLLWIEPPELFFPFQINKQISCSLKLQNQTDAHVAFFIKTDSEMQYKMVPEKGIVQPCSPFTVNITLLAQEETPERMRNTDEFTVKSTLINEGLTVEDITKDTFKKNSGNVVDKMRLGVVFDAQERAPCCISIEPEEHLSLTPLQILGCRETCETSFAVESSTHSVRDLGKMQVMDVPSKQDKRQYTSTSDASPRNPGGPLLLELGMKSSDRSPLWECKKTVMLELTGGNYSSDRPGLDLVAVLHVSPAGNIEHVRTAMRFVVRKLSPIDRLSIITLSWCPQRLCPLRQITTEDSQRELEELIDGINGYALTTNIDDGLQTGLEVLTGREVSAGRVAAMVLISNKLQRAGEDEATKVTAGFGNVPVYTFGYGDCSGSSMLKAVADSSMGGTFSHIRSSSTDDGDGDDDSDSDGDGDDGGLGLTVALSQCLAGLLSVSVLDLELTLEAIGQESRILEVIAGSYPQTQNNWDSVTLSFGNLYCREVRNVIVHLLLHATDSERSTEILKVSTRSSSGSLAPPEMLTVHRAGNKEDTEKPAELKMEEARLRTMSMIKEARAIQGLQGLKHLHDKLVEAQNMLMQEEEESSNHLLRTELKVLLNLTNSSVSYKCYGRHYALASESSHSWQRVAARGGDDIDYMWLFATPLMYRYLKQAKKFHRYAAFPLPSVDDDIQKEIAKSAPAINVASRSKLRRLFRGLHVQITWGQ